MSFLLLKFVNKKFLDVGGGQSPSILDSMKAALTATNNLSFIKTNYHSLDYKDVFYLATLGGATCEYCTEIFEKFQKKKTKFAFIEKHFINRSPIG